MCSEQSQELTSVVHNGYGVYVRDARRTSVRQQQTPRLLH